MASAGHRRLLSTYLMPMVLLIVAILLLLVIVVANLVTASGRSNGRFWFNILLFAGNGIFLIAGVTLLFVPEDTLVAVLPVNTFDLSLNRLGLPLAAMGLWGMLVTLTPVRRVVARYFPNLDPESAVHTLALVGIGYLAANGLFAATPGSLQALAEAEFSPTIVDVVVQQLFFVLVAVLGAGFLTRRGSPALRERLGLEWPTRSQMFVGLRWMLFFVFLQAIIGACWTLLNPDAAQQLGDLNQSLLGNFDTVWEWFVLAAAAGTGEEILFRGALQPIFGNFLTSAVFAISHSQYGLSPATLTVFLLSLVLGIIRNRSNTTVAIFVHAGYNFILGLLSLMVVYVEPLVGG